MAATWHLAPSLVQLRTEINRRWPNRSRSSDGSIGDAAHSSRASDHNPNGRRSVNAIDVTGKGIDAMALINTAIADNRTNYVIYNRVIRSRSNGFKVRAYTGPNPHTKHVHISIFQSSRSENDRSPWGLVGSASPGLPAAGAEGPSSGFPGASAFVMGKSHPAVKTVQQRLNVHGYKVGVDSVWGNQTKTATATFQRAQGWSGSDADGIPGAATWARLHLSPVPVSAPSISSRPAPTPVPPKEELSMADIKIITDALARQDQALARQAADLDALREEVKLVRAENAYTKKQNETLAGMLVDVPNKVWLQNVWRLVDGKRIGIPIIQEFADIKTQLAESLTKEDDA